MLSVGLTDSKRSVYVGLFFLYAALVVCFEWFAFLSLCAHYSEGWLSSRLLFSCLGFVASVLLFAVLWGRAKRSHVARFALVAIPVLVGFAFFVMPFSVPDEFTHINRVFDNRSGVSVLQVPAQMLDAYQWVTNYSELGTLLGIQFDYSWLKETEYVASSYSELNYFFPSLVVSAGKAFGVNGYVLVFAARLTNAALYLAACCWMLSTLPVGKKIAFVFLLNPMLLQQEASVSADALCNIGVLCFIVQVVALLERDRGGVRRFEWLLLAIFFVLVLVCKYVYLPLTLIAVLLISKIKNKVVRVAFPFVVALLGVVAVFFVLAVGYSNALDHILESLRIDSFLSTFFATLTQESLTMVWQFAGGNLGWPYMNYNDTPVTVRVPLCWIVFLVLLVMSVLSSSWRRSREKIVFRIAASVLVLFEAFLIYVALWGGAEIEGPVTWLQGRYFIPPVFLLLIACIPNKERAFPVMPPSAFLYSTVLLDLVSLAFVVGWFW